MKKFFRRHLKERSSDSEKSTCDSCDDMLNKRTDLKVHVHKFYEHGNDDEEGKMIKPRKNQIVEAYKGFFV